MSKSAEPVPKVAAAGIAGALTAVTIWVATYLYQVDIPPDVASALTTLIAFAAGYMAPPTGTK